MDNFNIKTYEIMCKSSGFEYLFLLGLGALPSLIFCNRSNLVLNRSQRLDARLSHEHVNCSLIVALSGRPHRSD